MQLTEHFALEEFTASATATANGIDNTPTSNALVNLKILAQSLELVREMLGYPITITSGYRSAELNAHPDIRGQKHSAHMDGMAADILCPEFGAPLQVCRAIENSGIMFDQVINEHGGRPGHTEWCHFGIAYRGMGGRRECLTIDSKGTRKGLDA